MCTAVSLKGKHHCFGRNLDLERSYGESVVITPRNFCFPMRYVDDLTSHYALIGMATVIQGIPLYYEATNEKGLSMAGLNFPGNACYQKCADEKDNIASFELIMWILGKCSTVSEAKELLKHIQVVDVSFSEQICVSPLHWMISDKDESIVLECVEEGLKIYDNPWNVLTNNPPFEYHLLNINQYMHLHEGQSINHLDVSVNLKNFSLGFGALGLPGDYSSVSRFVRACFVKSKLLLTESKEDTINQFFHLLNAVSMPKGCVLCPNGEFEYTRYSCCCTDDGVYTYTTYENSAKRSIDMKSYDLDGNLIYSNPINN